MKRKTTPAKRAHRVHKTVHRRKSPLAVAIVAIVVIVIAALWLLFAQPKPQPTNSPSTVLATVNGEPITQAQVDSLYARLPAAQQTPAAKEQLLNQTLVQEDVLLQEAKREGITVTQAEADDAFNTLLAQNGYDLATFQSYLASRNLSYNDIRSDFTRNLIISKLINQTIVSQTSVTNSDIEAFYNSQNLSDMNITLNNQTRTQIRSLLMNQRVNNGVQLLLKNLLDKANIVYYKSPQ